MKKIIRIGIVSPLLFLLQGCQFLNDPHPTQYDHVENYSGVYYDYNNYYQDERTNLDYSDNASSSYDSYDNYYSKPSINVPQTYHTSQGRQATSHKSRDKNWVKSQSGSGYTIQLDNDDKPAKVAKTLITAPKNHRTAQIRYNRNGKPRYTGVYGSYPSKTEAEKAYKRLPPNLKNKANIKKWQSIQKEM